MQYRARATFKNRRGQLVDRGDWIEDEAYGRELARARLVEAIPDELAPPERVAHLRAPEIAAGKPPAAGGDARSSASPAGRVSPQTIASGSAPGVLTARRHRRAARIGQDLLTDGSSL